LPVGDLTVGGMIGDPVAGRAVSFEVINPNPDPVCNQFAILGADSSQITHVQKGYDCVEQFTGRYLDEQARELVRRLRGRPGPLSTGSLTVSWVDPRTQRRVAHLGDRDPRTGDLLVDPSAGGPTLPAALDLGTLLAGFPDAERLVAVAADGRHLPIVDTWISKAPPGETVPPWISLIPSGLPAY
jgi:hypothetical protein